jgi:hypothetical protein
MTKLLIFLVSSSSGSKWNYPNHANNYWRSHSLHLAFEQEKHIKTSF